MTEPHTAGSDPTLLETRAVDDGDAWVIDGRKWFSSNGSVADFLIVMAVTDPDAQRYQRASMFIVPADTPGVRILRDVPTMEHPESTSGATAGTPRSLYEGVRIPRTTSSERGGAGFLIAQQRLGPGRIHHCMRWLGVSRAPSTCSASTRWAATARVAARRQADQRTGSPILAPRCRPRG
jgi:acyl-CoA dehydrogenase